MNEPAASKPTRQTDAPNRPKLTYSPPGSRRNKGFVIVLRVFLTSVVAGWLAFLIWKGLATSSLGGIAATVVLASLLLLILVPHESTLLLGHVLACVPLMLFGLLMAGSPNFYRWVFDARTGHVPDLAGVLGGASVLAGVAAAFIASEVDPEERSPVALALAPLMLVLSVMGAGSRNDRW